MQTCESISLHFLLKITNLWALKCKVLGKEICSGGSLKAKVGMPIEKLKPLCENCGPYDLLRGFA